MGTDLLGRYYAEVFGVSVMTTRMFTHTGPRRGDVFHESTFAKQIAMIEAGKRDITISALFKISRALNSNMQQIFDFDDVEKYKFNIEKFYE